VIYIATIHYKTEKWIDIQARYINKYITEPYRVYAVLNDIEQSFSDRFYFTTDFISSNLTVSAAHAEKLNFLADKIISEASNEDLLIFMDGDAFPISSDFTSFIKEKIKKNKLAAVRRDETLTDLQAHPSFCATTVGFWKQIKGDWSSGYQWDDLLGEKVTDTGAELLRKLREQRIDWFPMLRSNKKNLHPLWFGVYSRVIYHHGGGFRWPVCQLDRKIFPFKHIEKLKDHKVDSKSLFDKFVRLIGRIWQKLWLSKMFRLKHGIYNKIKENDLFYLMFLD